MSFTLNAVAQAKGSHSNTGANDSAEPLNTTPSRSRTPGAKGGVSPTSSHHLFSRESFELRCFSFNWKVGNETPCIIVWSVCSGRQRSGASAGTQRQEYGVEHIRW